MRIVTAKQMAEVENISEEMGVTKEILMQNAGRKIAERIMQITSDKNIVFLAGSGNNGGDCFVCACILADKGYNTTVINLVKAPSTDLAKKNFSILPDNVRIITGYESDSIIEIKNAVSSADILVDGVFGTGFRGELNAELTAVFSLETNAYKIAVDIPSGGNATTGTVSTGTFKADETICLGCLKFGLTQYPLKKFCGNITVADIGIPFQAYDLIKGKRKYYTLEKNSLKDFPLKREPDSHKGTFGTVLIIAGSSLMRGAGAFAVLGALKSGAGLVRLATVAKCIDTVSVLAPEATFIELESDENGFMKFNENVLANALKKVNAVVIGCGMGVTEDTAKIVRFVVQNAEVPVIIDADGINCTAQDIEILVNKKTEVIITPHPGEMARLLKSNTKTINENRSKFAEDMAEQYGITVVLKGAGTVIADNCRMSVNTTGNAGMSKGGSGDVLSGIIGAVVAQNIPLYDAVCAGVFIHGLAGDIACENYGQEAMLPRDVINCLSDAFRILREK